MSSDRTDRAPALGKQTGQAAGAVSLIEQLK
jgi:hypothetical protein